MPAATTQTTAPQPAPPPAPAPAPRPDAPQQTKLNELKPREWWREQPEDWNTLSAHVIDKLVAGGIKTVEAVREAGPDKLLGIEGIGKVALEEIKTWLRGLDKGKA